MKENNCIICFEDFIPDKFHPKQMCCSYKCISIKCYLEYYYRRKSLNKCVSCAKEKDPKNIIYKGERCSICLKKDLEYMRKRKKVKEHRREITNCIICYKDITDKYPHRKYCSECRKILINSSKKQREEIIKYASF